MVAFELARPQLKIE